MKPLNLWLIVAALAAGQTLPSSAVANPYTTTLDNGLRVIVREDHRAPTAVHMVWYRAGSMDEFNGTTGVAHVLEHLMFKGTPAVGPGQFNARVAALGGRDNAFTSRDYTAYFQQVPASALPDVMALEADRMRHLLLAPEAFAKEIEVVKEERRLRTEDQPHGLLWERLMANTFMAHPYRRPVIGWMADIEHMVVADTREWYDRWYAPNNATLVVVGDVDHKAVFADAQKHYGAVAARDLPERKPQPEPDPRGIKRLTVAAPAKLPYLAMAWQVPRLEDAAQGGDVYALEMLAAVLSGHDGARLPKQLVRRRALATDVSAGNDGIGRGPALFVIEGTPSQGVSAADLEAAVRAQLAQLVRHGVEETELARARAQLVASRVYGRDSLFRQAMEIGRLEMSGLGHGAADHMIEGLKAVTPAEVRDAAARYLVDGRLTVAVLDPQGGRP